MTAPNLRFPTSVTGKTVPAILGTSLASILSNGSTSNKVLKVNIIRISNTSNADTTVNVSFRRSGTDYYVAYSTLVQPGNSLIVLDKNEFIYLEEGDAIYASKAAASTAHMLIHYEDIAN